MTQYVLVAGDSKKNLSLVKKLLSEHDVEIVPAPTTALALFLAQKNFPCAIVCDRTFRDGEGIFFLQEVKADKELRSIPFIFLLPTQVDPPVESDLIKSGACAVVDLQQSQKLLALLRKFIGKAQQRTQRNQNESTE
jgi:CheY-like chemotaxis protein